ncbi:hypothetical protein D3C76_1762010 [compost metagenome]
MQQFKFLGRQFKPVPGAHHLTRLQIHHNILKDQTLAASLSRRILAAKQSSHPSQQFLQCKRFDQVIVGTDI